jgi:hypothetical protein
MQMLSFETLKPNVCNHFQGVQSSDNNHGTHYLMNANPCNIASVEKNLILSEFLRFPPTFSFTNAEVFIFYKKTTKTAPRHFQPTEHGTRTLTSLKDFQTR